LKYGKLAAAPQMLLAQLKLLEKSEENKAEALARKRGIPLKTYPMKPPNSIPKKKCKDCLLSKP